MTKCLILAAGQGTRLGQMTADKPKCMVPIFGVPIIQRQAETLKLAGIEDISVATGYKASMVDSLGFFTHYNPNYKNTNMVSSMFVARQLFAHIGSQTQFPDHLFWLILMSAVFAERFGGMHIQLLLTSNIAIAHVANGVTGVIWIVGLFVLLPIMGALALPVSMLIAYAGFYAWYSAAPALRSIPGVSFWKFEGQVVLIPVAYFIVT